MTAQILDIPAADYHADPCPEPSLSASCIKTLTTHSPAHARENHPRLNPLLVRDEDPKYDQGRAAHSLFLEGDGNVEVFIYDDWRSKAAKEARAEARAHGKTPMLGKHWDDVQAMVLALQAKLEASTLRPPLFMDGTPERTLVWQEGDVWCRARLDWLRDDYAAIDDYKTTSASANPDAWTARTMWGIGADVQAAFYLRGLAAVSSSVSPQFRFVVQETFPPYESSVVSLSPSALALADAKVDAAIRTWRHCLTTDKWPGYQTQIAYAEPTAWMEAEWLVREGREEEAA